MIAHGYMNDNLRRLDNLYRSARSPKEALFYAKLAILELCGWIEESMDDVVMRCSIRCLADPANRKFVADTVVKKNYGFQYEQHFRGMMMKVIGLQRVEELEGRVDPIKLGRLTAALTALHQVRNAEAHTHLKGVTKVINAPSVTIAQFTDVYEGLIAYDRTLRKYVA